MAFTKTITGLFLFSVVISLFVSPLLLVCPQAAQAEEPEVNGSEVEYWAVIIGISDYSADALDLGDNTDAEDLYGRLAPIWGEDHIKLLVDDEATKENIRDAICVWLDEHEDFNDVSLFYFAGHGNRGALAPYDSSMYISGKVISRVELKDWLEELESDNIVVILDSCLSGSFIKDLSEPGRIILTSSSANQGSWGSEYLGHSIFTFFILDSLFYVYEVDSNDDYEVSVEEVFARAEPRVVDTVEGWGESQNPQMDDNYDGELGLFYEATLHVNPENESLNVDVDGLIYSSEIFPEKFRWTPNSTHTFSINSSAPEWISSSPVTVSQGGDYYLVYLDIESEYGDLQGEGWYEKDAMVNVSISSPLGIIIRDAFTGWSGDIKTSDLEATVSMNMPKRIVATWHKDYSQLYILIGGVIAALFVIAASGVFFFVRRRRKIRLITTPTEFALPSVQQDQSISPQ